MEATQIQRVNDILRLVRLSSLSKGEISIIDSLYADILDMELSDCEIYDLTSFIIAERQKTGMSFYYDRDVFVALIAKTANCGVIPPVNQKNERGIFLGSVS